ncbi:phage minor head protein [Acinetobacter sp. c3-l95]|uniref:phage head morphogenesis protein n=1 Tax=Acinetobacter sp. c3-l95 TaxID=3342804 RepID=UPI0035B790BF
MAKTDILPNKQAIISFQGKTLLTTQSYLDIKAYEHAIAFTVAKMADADLLQDTRNAILAAMQNGTDFREFKKQLLPLLNSQGWGNFTDDRKILNRRLKIIFHTNMHSAYAAGQWQRIQQTKDMLPYLQYMPSVSVKKRDNHKAYYGLVRHVDDPIWSSIYPPNGYGCKCWVKQLTKRQAQKVGISDHVKLDMETVENPKTGEMMQTPKGVHFSFNHNHDRLAALLKLAEDKHGTEFGERLRKQVDDFTLDLIFQPNFNRGIETVMGVAFANRFAKLQSIIKETDGSRDNSMAIRKAHAKGDNYAVATISPSIQQALGSETAIVWLSDDTMIKMLAHHPELDLLALFRDTASIIKNAKLIIQEGDTHVSYFQVGEAYYKATIKITQDKKELYLLTVFSTNEKEIKRVLKKSNNIIVNNIG